MALTKTFQQLAAHPLDSAAMAAHFADTLVAIHPALAGHVVDALAERVGR